MSRKYQNLLSPIKVGNIVFKNRLTAPPSKPHYIQGPEEYATEGLMTHYANKAKNGAGLVSIGGHTFAHTIPVVASQNGYDWYRMSVDGQDPPVLPVTKQESYLCQLTEAIHFYGARAEMGIWADLPPQYDVSAGLPSRYMAGGTRVIGESKEASEDMLEELADEYALQAAFMRAMGFDMVFLHMSYRAGLLGRFLSPLTNKRTDRYGGSLENMARLPLMVFDRVKQKCGPDLLIQACISGEEPEGGTTLDDAIEYARMFAGHLDLLMIRAGDADTSCPTGFVPESSPTIRMLEAVKKSGVDIAVVASGGYQNLDICEDVIASGKADFIAMARSWISNPDYGRKAYEGRGEDVVPCIRCQKCHKSNIHDPLVSVCSVNPIWGFEHKIERMIEPPTTQKKVAVVGGGPAGMEAALVAAGRGHRVTLYEKSDVLGGLLNTADNVSFKWPLRDFKNYLVRQIDKSNVKVCLNTEATAELLGEGEYDVVLAAVGSESIVPPIPGVDSDNVVFAQDVYGNEAALAEDVVVIGGGEIGVETGIHLAEKGHNVTVLEMLDKLAADAPPVNYSSVLKKAWEQLENFHYVLQARCNCIGADGVTYYLDAAGLEHTVKAGSVVLAVGMKPKNNLALQLYGASDQFFMIGDCNGAGNVQRVMRSAFSTAVAL